MRKKGEVKEDSDEEKNENLISKEAVLADLNLGNVEGGIGAGKYG